MTVQCGEDAGPTLLTRHNPDDDPKPRDFETWEGNSRVHHTSRFSLIKYLVITRWVPGAEQGLEGKSAKKTEKVPFLMEHTI